MIFTTHNFKMLQVYIKGNYSFVVTVQENHKELDLSGHILLSIL